MEEMTMLIRFVEDILLVAIIPNFVTTAMAYSSLLPREGPTMRPTLTAISVVSLGDLVAL